MATRDIVDAQLHGFRRKVLLPTLVAFSIIIPFGAIISLIEGSLANYYFIPLIAVATSWAGLLILLRTDRIPLSFAVFSAGLSMVLFLFPLVTEDPVFTFNFFLLFIFVMYTLLTFLAGLFGTRFVIFMFPGLFFAQMAITLTFFGDLPLLALLGNANTFIPFLSLALISLLARANNREFQRIIMRLLRTEMRNKNLSSLSITDPMTGLLNRRNLDDLLLAEFQRAHNSGTALSCLMIDIDHFKSINDNLGHQFGDQVIARIAQLIKDNSRSEDICARYGGEEFLILSQIPSGNAVKFSEKLLQIISSAQLEIDGHSRAVTVSIGVASMEDRPLDAYDLVKQADRALYRAKQAGRNRVESVSGA
jgi:diguanylate cyclase (GGDEF)-like protein